MIRIHIGHRAVAAFQHAENLRDHVAGALQLHRVTDADVFARDLILIVQRGVAHQHAADIDRLEVRARRQRAGAADLDFDAFQNGGGAFRGKLPGGRPARRAAGKTKPGLQGEVVDFIHHAVDIIGQFRAAKADFILKIFGLRLGDAFV